MMRIEKSWHAVLKKELEKPYIVDLKKAIMHERNSHKPIYPPEEDVFNAFKHTPFYSTKVVLVGQDPYHGANQANGLCFSVNKNVPIPPSLKNIYKELRSDLGCAIPDNGCLKKWALQGVLMLNATLTVRESCPKSHHGLGWEVFTDAVIKAVYDKLDGVVFILWGALAREKCNFLKGFEPKTHKFLTAAHPSPFSATKFLGCSHFSRCNNYLISLNKTPIDWCLDG